MFREMKGQELGIPAVKCVCQKSEGNHLQNRTECVIFKPVERWGKKKEHPSNSKETRFGVREAGEGSTEWAKIQSIGHKRCKTKRNPNISW